MLQVGFIVFYPVEPKADFLMLDIFKCAQLSQALAIVSYCWLTETMVVEVQWA